MENSSDIYKPTKREISDEKNSNCIDDGYVSNKTTVMFWQFHKYFVKNMISRDTTKEDIDMGDRFLNTIIAELEK